jgi:hypothetical protein
MKRGRHEGRGRPPGKPPQNRGGGARPSALGGAGTVGHPSGGGCCTVASFPTGAAGRTSREAGPGGNRTAQRGASGARHGSGHLNGDGVTAAGPPIVCRQSSQSAGAAVFGAGEKIVASRRGGSGTRGSTGLTRRFQSAVIAGGGVAAALEAVLVWPWRPAAAVEWVFWLRGSPLGLLPRTGVLVVLLFPALLMLPVPAPHGPDRGLRAVTTACGGLVSVRAAWLVAAHAGEVPAPNLAVLLGLGVAIPALMAATFARRGWVGMAVVAAADAFGTGMGWGHVAAALQSVWLMWLAALLLRGGRFSDGFHRPATGPRSSPAHFLGF